MSGLGSGDEDWRVFIGRDLLQTAISRGVRFTILEP